MHLMVAGCSFSAVSQTLPGTSWSELLANRLGWRLTNLARQGCSNGGIRIQIDEIRRQRPDFAIVTPSFWDRMEIPAKAAPYQPFDSALDKGLDLQHHLQDRSKGNGYDPAAGIDNVNYGNNPYRMICETIFSLCENQEHRYRGVKLDRNAQTAVKYYVDCLYDSNWKKQQDEWIIREGVMTMYLEGIRFLLVPVLLWPFDPQWPDQWSEIMPEIIPRHYVMSNEPESVLPLTGNNPHQGEDPGYHSNQHGQQLIADNYHRRIANDFNLA